MKYFLPLALILLWIPVSAQSIFPSTSNTPDWQAGVEYEIGGVSVTGADELDPHVVILLSGLTVGDHLTLPGEKVAEAVKTLWGQKLFDDVQIYVTERQGNLVFLTIALKPLPKLSKFYFTGLSKTQQDAVRELIKWQRGAVVGENVIKTGQNAIVKRYVEKGYPDTKVTITQEPDSLYPGTVILGIHVSRGERIRIVDIVFEGNASLSESVLRRKMKETHQYNKWNIFQTSKMLQDKYEDDKRSIVAYYNQKGFRDARIARDSSYRTADGLVLQLVVEEGHPYFFRNIEFVGNAEYPTTVLRDILRIHKGERYDAKRLYERINGDPNGNDVASVYLNNGYLFSQVNPVEVRVEGDSIDLEIRIREGRPATVNKVIVLGNDRTNDHVIYREIRTRPGDLFSKADIQRTIRELGQLGYFDARNIGITPKPNPETGTVDLEYTVVEQSTSQLEMQGGWGAYTVVGTLGLNFNNFSARNIGNKSAWKPLPTGDGQTINLRAQTNGTYYSSYSASFTEPWLGGKKPNAFTVSAYHNMMNQNGAKDSTARSIAITGVSVGLGRRLKWPDDYFTLHQSLEYKRFNVNNYPFIGGNFKVGIMQTVLYNFSLRRDNRDYPIFPTRGSSVSLVLEAAPPISLLDGRDYSKLSDEERYKFLEYHKWKINAEYYVKLAKNTVLRSFNEFGFLGSYNKEYGLPPVERYYMGGDGLQNFVLDGREIIGLRGYTNYSLTPTGGGALYTKFSTELRYLVTPNPSAQIFLLGFAEAGNNYGTFADFRPFELKRSAGVGLRIFMPMFGMLGVDVAHGFDPLPGQESKSGWRTHFVMGQQF